MLKKGAIFKLNYYGNDNKLAYTIKLNKLDCTNIK